MVDALLNWSPAPYVLAGAGLLSALALLALAWTGIPGIDRFSRNTIQRLAKNSAAPIVGQLANRAVDLVFAAFMLRILGVTGNGQYAIAVVTWLYIKTITDFGLSVLVTREVARAPEQSGQLLGASTLLRLAILAALIPLVGAYALGGLTFWHLSPASAIAIALLIVSIVPGSYTEAVNSIFNGHERMELPAGLNVMTNLARAGLGLAALAAGFGVVGLAAVALISTSLSALAFHVALRHVGVRPAWSLPREQARWLLALSWPLLLNGLLVQLFFRADVFVIQATHGDRALGVYDAAYKLINTLLILPAYFTLAVFPLLSRYAASDHERLRDGYQLSVKFMTILAWPIALGTVALAPLLIEILGGRDFLPDSATALRILIWFLPVSYVNGIIQYVLVAANQQRLITRAFVLAVLFNLVANALLVPLFSYYAAAAVTVATELVLFVPLLRATRRHVGDIDWVAAWLRPTIAAAGMGLALTLASPLGVVPAALLGTAIYPFSLVAAGAVGKREADIARALLGRADTAVS